MYYKKKCTHKFGHCIIIYGNKSDLHCNSYINFNVKIDAEKLILWETTLIASVNFPQMYLPH